MTAPLAQQSHWAPVQSVADRRISFLVLAFFALIPLEGVLRKWLLNSIEQPLIFIRDPIAILLPVVYLMSRENLPTWLVAWYAVFCCFIALAIVQFLVFDVSPFILLFGIRNYLFYIPLMFVIGERLSSLDLRKIVLLAICISIPNALLVILQFYSSVDSELNRGVTDDIEGRFLVVAGIVRPYGAFTFVAAQAVFVSVAAGLVTCGFLHRKRWHLSAPLLIAAALSVMVMVALSGSRSVFLSVMAIGLFYSVGVVVAKGARAALPIAAATLAAAVFVGIFVFVFPTAFDAMSERQEIAVSEEGSTVDRVLSVVLDLLPAIDAAPFAGYGIGAGSNAAAFFSTGYRDFQLAEYESARVILELGPAFGIAMLLFRFGIVVYLGWRALKYAHDSGDASAFVMTGVVTPIFLGGQISGVNQMVSFSWFSAGLCLALSRSLRRPG